MVALPPDDGKTLEQKQPRFGQFAHQPRLELSRREYRNACRSKLERKR
jgi:hypothetical protein